MRKWFHRFVIKLSDDEQEYYDGGRECNLFEMAFHFLHSFMIASANFSNVSAI